MSETTDEEKEELLRRSRAAIQRAVPTTDIDTGAILRQLLIQELRILSHRYPRGNGIDSMVVSIRGAGILVQEFERVDDRHWGVWPPRDGRRSGSTDLVRYAIDVLRQHQVLEDLSEV
jgi:hypothetical protein